MSAVPDRWLVVEARDPRGDPDGRVAEALLALGGRAVEEDAGWLRTHLDAGAADAPPADEAEVGERLRTLSGVDELEVRTAMQEHGDWAELWKRGLEPRRVGTRFVVTPSWTRPEAGGDDIVLVLDPGMAFGNAEHGTTRGCLRLLERLVRPGDRVLDVGAGSGVLAIAAARLGAARVVAVEADPWAVPACLDNARANGVADRVEVHEAVATVDSLRGYEPFDGVVANIERGVLAPLLDGLAAAVAPGGWLLLSGLLAHEWDAMEAAAIERGLESEAVDADGEWRSGALVRPPTPADPE